MALSPKWSEEARKSKKETNIDERMHARALRQKEIIANDKMSADANSMPEIPSYKEANHLEQREEPRPVLSNKANADEALKDIMARIDTVVHNEIRKLVDEGRLKV